MNDIRLQSYEDFKKEQKLPKGVKLLKLNDQYIFVKWFVTRWVPLSDKEIKILYG